MVQNTVKSQYFCKSDLISQQPDEVTFGLALFVTHLKQTMREHILEHVDVSTYQPKSQNFMTLDNNCLEQLEIIDEN